MLFELVKMSLRITTNALDDEINQYIEQALLDLGIAGVIPETLTTTGTDALIIGAVITFCQIKFGKPELKASYDEQKAQLITATNYTDWLGGAG